MPLIFLGFPFQKHTNTDDTVPSLASFVKHAFLAGAEAIDATHSMLVLDAVNNYGFSGGPVLISKPELPLRYCVFGITSTFTAGVEAILDANNGRLMLSFSTARGSPYFQRVLNMLREKELRSSVISQTGDFVTLLVWRRSHGEI